MISVKATIGNPMEIILNERISTLHQRNSPSETEKASWIALDPFNPFIDSSCSAREITDAEVDGDACNTFFDVIDALEQEAYRLGLNLLAAVLERALDASLLERKRLARGAPPFPERETEKVEGPRKSTFRSVRSNEAWKEFTPSSSH